MARAKAAKALVAKRAAASSSAGDAAQSLNKAVFGFYRGEQAARCGENIPDKRPAKRPNKMPANDHVAVVGWKKRKSRVRQRNKARVTPFER